MGLSHKQNFNCIGSTYITINVKTRVQRLFHPCNSRFLVHACLPEQAMGKRKQPSLQFLLGKERKKNGGSFTTRFIFKVKIDVLKINRYSVLYRKHCFLYNTLYL
ncbi:hypothetical protein QOZ95_002769 [Paenibacillus brasilensis]|uniref:Uncharacterized protein n=1 Tax=Paenibacillus brasilensis TaxID=128574 RepID=A0ABU0L2G0_9BACL|nr:hypothetical protein [Paenibacillus brasilensis]